MTIAQPKPPTLAAIAARLAAHLRRFEASPTINAPVSRGDMELPPYYQAFANDHGRRVFIVYCLHERGVKLTKAQALGYLAWLDAGGVGRHWEWERAARAATKEIER